VNPPPSRRELPLIDLLQEQDRREIWKQVKEEHYRKGEYIFREGDRAEYFHILKEGTVKCVRATSAGKECTLKVLMPGDLFCCEAAVFDGGQHPGTAAPMGDVSILRVNKEQYFNILKKNPEAALEVIKYLGKRLTEVQERAKILALDRSDQRLASLLVGLAERIGVSEPQGIRLDVRLTRQDLSDMVGITPETTIRIMSRFRQAKLVSGTAKQLMILNLSALRSFASDPSSVLP
jgi:CRP/FNR family cyclic AMP-dependent transcriptional regulator